MKVLILFYMLSSIVFSGESILPARPNFYQAPKYFGIDKKVVYHKDSVEVYFELEKKLDTNIPAKIRLSSSNKCLVFDKDEFSIDTQEKNHSFLIHLKKKCNFSMGVFSFIVEYDYPVEVAREYIANNLDQYPKAHGLEHLLKKLDKEKGKDQVTTMVFNKKFLK